ncbi:MAG: hypothetical protein IIT36_02085 [Aeriscardovia sp.]|nr:hypothetical protein [Aeriscardovia sp.]
MADSTLLPSFVENIIGRGGVLGPLRHGWKHEDGDDKDQEEQNGLLRAAFQSDAHCKAVSV